MAIRIQTAGLDDYLDGDGGTANIKALILGRAGSGKTRSSSYWKNPLLLDCEDGRAVLADRGTPYVEIESEQDVNDIIAYLKKEAGKPSRTFDTVILDTLDGLQQRLIRNHLAKVRRSRMEAFEGDYDAVNNPIKNLIHTLRDLPINVVVLVHLKEAGKVTKKDEVAAHAGEDTLTMAQGWSIDLVGDVREKAAGWFDLVGLMQNEWASEKVGKETKQVIKRSIRWQPIPEVPFLKDRLYAFPPSTPVNFSDEDYTRLVKYIEKKATGLKRSEVVGEVEGALDNAAPADVAGGPVAPNPSGVLSKPRQRVETPPAESTPEPATTEAAEESAPVEAPAEPSGVEVAKEVLGAEVIAEECDWVALGEAATTVEEVRAIWKRAEAANELTSTVKAALAVHGRALKA